MLNLLAFIHHSAHRDKFFKRKPRIVKRSFPGFHHQLFGLFAHRLATTENTGNVMSNKAKSFIHLSLILALGLLIFLPRLQVLPFRGEEPRRVVCAFEMLQSGNWFVPTIQNELFLSRPPLQNWIIAATGVVRGTFDHLTGRLPTLFSLLITCLLIYFYCTSTMSRRTALLAALFFLTMPQVLQLGLTAETELMFTALLSGSFLLWHCGDLRKWNPYLKWGCAYVLLGLATLTKGINQAPVYFAAIVGIYLLLNRRLKELFSMAHILSFFWFIFIVGSWQWGFIHYVGAKTGWLMHLGDVELRFNGLGLKDYLAHGVIFPFELLGVMLPWSLFLFLYASPTFWRKCLPLESKPIAIFCLAAIGITIFSVWYPPGSRTRYYMPLFPCVAILAAIAAEAIWSLKDQEIRKIWWTRSCSVFMNCMLLLIPLAGLCFMGWAFLSSKLHLPPLPWADVLFYLAGCFGIGLVLWTMQPTSNRFGVYVIGYALFAALTLNFIYMDTRQEKYNDVQSQVVSGLKTLPKDTNLMSLGAIPSDFLYYYVLHRGKTIPILTEQDLKKQKDPVYFCTASTNKQPGSSILLTIDSGRYKRKYTNRFIEQIVIKVLLRRDGSGPSPT